MFYKHAQAFFRKNGLILLGLTTAFSILLPALSASLLLITVIGAITISGLHLASAFWPSAYPKNRLPVQRRLQRQPFVSIHVACHNEPPQLVTQALTALSRINYQNFEVLVIDNNTTNPALWQPIKAKCKQLGDRFKFFHVENMKGFKAGALNYALRHMNPETEIITVVDADYIVTPDFLQLGVAAFADEKTVLIQFPQRYVNVGPYNTGLTNDFGSFFDAILNQANHLNAVTAIGTMGLFRARVFKQHAMNWNEWCITEDTEIGVHLYTLGYRGVFINRCAGKGLMPHDYYSLKRQRQRWSYGNTQILKKDFLSTLTNTKLSLGQKISLLTQLSAWWHPYFIPATILIASLITNLIFSQPHFARLAAASLAVISIFTIIQSLFFAVLLSRKHSFSTTKWLMTLSGHFGLTVTMSTAWLQAFLNPSLPYNRTNKNPIESPPRSLPPELIWALVFLSTGTLSIVFDDTMPIIITIGTILTGLLLATASILLLWQLQQTKKITQQVLKTVYTENHENRHNRAHLVAHTA